jgi:hypothetical protein
MNSPAAQNNSYPDFTLAPRPRQALISSCEKSSETNRRATLEGDVVGLRDIFRAVLLERQVLHG